MILAEERLDDIRAACKSSVHLTVNEHTVNYENIEEYLYRLNDRFPGDNEISKDDFERFVKKGFVYELHFYPDTPIGSYCVYGTSLSEVIEKAEGILRAEGKL